MLGLAMYVALTTRGALRWAGAGLFPLLFLGFSVLPAVLEEDHFAPPPRDFPLVNTSIGTGFIVAPMYVDLDRVTRGNTNAYPLPTREPTPPPPPIEVVAGAPVDDIRVTETHPGPVFGAAALLVGLASIATSLFPYRR